MSLASRMLIALARLASAASRCASATSQARFAPLSTKTTRTILSERLLQAWFVPRWMRTSPPPGCRSCAPGRAGTRRSGRCSRRSAAPDGTAGWSDPRATVEEAGSASSSQRFVRPTFGECDGRKTWGAGRSSRRMDRPSVSSPVTIRRTGVTILCRLSREWAPAPCASCRPS